MATLEQVKDMIMKELAPIHLKVKELAENYSELSKALSFVSTKYDDIVKQIQVSNAKVDRQLTDVAKIKQDIKIIDKRAIEAEQEVDDLSQYIRRDCLEISGIKTTKDNSAEDLV